MPKQSIREIDRTGGETVANLDYTVFVPGPYLTYKDANNKDVVLRGTFTNASDFDKTFTNVTVDTFAIPYREDYGFLMAYELLKKGLTIEFVPVYKLGVTDGQTAVEVTKTLINSLHRDEHGKFDYPEITTNFDAQSFLTDLYNEFSDRAKYDLRFITIGGINNSFEGDVGSLFEEASVEAIKCAGNRADAVAILDAAEKGDAPIDSFYSVWEGEEGGQPVYSPTEETGYEHKWFEEAEAKEKIGDDLSEYTHYTNFAVYKKGNEYSAGPTTGFTKIKLTLDDYNTLNAEIQVLCQTEESEAEVLDTSSKIDTWVNETFKDICQTPIIRNGVSWTADENETEKYGRYGAIFSCISTIDISINGKIESIRVPASFIYLTCFAKYIKYYKSWFAMTGATRGYSPYSPVFPSVVFGDADVNNVFQIRTCDKDDTTKLNHIATNVIYNDRPYGNVVWGNRTMHPLNVPDDSAGDAAVQLVASSFLNIRHLCIDIKKALYRAAKYFTFDPNSDTLWFNFKNAITPLLEDMKANQGIKGYKLYKVKTNKKALLSAVIAIHPIEAVEDFDLTVELSDSIEVNE